MKTSKYLIAAVILGVSLMFSSCIVPYESGNHHSRHGHHDDRGDRGGYDEGAYRY